MGLNLDLFEYLDFRVHHYFINSKCGARDLIHDDIVISG
jgi:hypothetical protein